MKRTVWALGLPLALSLSYFFGGGGNNQNSRLDLTRAITEEHRLRIDSYHSSTSDETFFRGHHYSNKAPGQPLLGVPAVAGTRAVLRAIGSEPSSVSGVNWIAYLGTIWTASLPTALAALALVWIAMRLGASPTAAWFSALVFALGTPIWAYSTIYWGHSLAAACLVFAFAALLGLGSSSDRRGDLRWGAALGTSAGWAVVTEYGAATAACAIAVAALALTIRERRRRATPVLAAIGIPATACVAMILTYHTLCFGSPWLTPMKLYFVERHIDHYFVAPSLHSLDEILLSDAHGLLTISPILCIAPIGYFLFPPEKQLYGWLAAAVSLSFVVLNCCFWIPGGGWGFGPRYLAPALPFLCLPLAFVWDRGRSALRALMLPVALYGGFVTLMAVSVKPEPPEYLAPPVSEFLWPAFRDGDLSVNYQSMLDNGIPDWPQRFRGRVHVHQAFNLGEKLGLTGLTSLLPLAGAWAAAAIYLAFARRRDRSSGAA
jgi:hypothetical protein